MKIIFTSFLQLLLLHGFSQIDSTRFPLIDSLINNNNYKYQLINREFGQVMKDSSQYFNLYNSIKLCTGYFLYLPEDSKLDSNIISNLKEISKIYSSEGLSLILTSGTDGNGGRGLMELDKITLEYKFIYVTVGDLSCFPGRLEIAISNFNNETISYLNSINREGWRDELEQKMKKRKKEKNKAGPCRLVFPL